MDLVIVGTDINPQIGTLVVTPTSCALSEGCILNTGTRTILKFSTNVANQGQAVFTPPGPPDQHPEIYVWGQCHGHWHDVGFAHVQILDSTGQVTISNSRKLAYCAEDSYRFQNGPDVNCFGSTTCDAQGLSIGWVDVYGPDLDCQFMDITNIPAGSYILRQCVNPLLTFLEATSENNCADIGFVIPSRKRNDVNITEDVV